MAVRVDRAASPVSGLLPAWWWGRAWSIAWIRVSANDKDKLTRNGEAAVTQVLASHPAVARVREVGGVSAILEDQDLRDRLGVIEIHRRDASPFAEAPDRLMGYLWIVPEVAGAILLISDSAGEFNVHVPGTLLPDNAAMILLQSFLLMPNVKELHVTRWDRLVRERRLGASVVAAAQMGSTLLFCDGVKTDIYTASGTLVTDLKNGTAASNRTTGRDTMLSGVLARLQQDRVEWPYSRYMAPPAYIVRREGPEDAVKRKAFLLPDQAHRAAWREFYLAVGRGETWAACAAILVAAQVPTRGQQLSAKTWADLTPRQASRAAKSAASVDNLNTLRTRTLTVTSEMVEPRDPERPEWRGMPVVQDGTAYGSLDVKVALPDHGLDLTDDEWLSCLRQREERTSRVPTSDRATAIAVGLPAWEDGGRQFKLSRNGGYYTVRSRDAADGLDQAGRKRGCDSHEGRLEASFAWQVLDRAMAQLVLEGAHSLLDSGAVFRTPTPREPADDVARTAQRAALELAVSEAMDEVDVRRLAADNATDAIRDRRLAQLATAQESAAAAVAALERHDALPTAQKVVRSAELDLSGFAGLAACIERYAGTCAPRVINDALRGMFGRSLRVSTDPGDGLVVTLSAELQCQDKTGSTVLVPVTTKIRNSCLATRQLHDREETAAALILRDGYSIHEARTLLRTHSTDRFADRVRRGISRRYGVGASQANSMLDCPLAEVRAVIWRLMNGEAAECDPRFEARLRSAYLEDHGRHRGSWASPQGVQRRILAALEWAEGRGMDLSAGIHVNDLAQASGVSSSQILSHTVAPGSGDKALLCHHPDDARIVTPQSCSTCGDWMLHVLLAPETRASAGLICRRCSATADGVPLPAGYLRLWDAAASEDADRAFETVEYTSRDYDVCAPGGPAVRRVSMREAVKLTGMVSHVLRKATCTGELECVRRGGSKERWFDPQDLEEFRRRHEGRPGFLPGENVPDGYVLLQPAAAERDVPDHALRRLVRSSGPDEGPVRYVRMTINGRAGCIVVNCADLQAVGQDWFDAHRRGRILIGEACRLTGLSPARMRLLAKGGSVPHMRTAKGTLTFDPHELTMWLQGPGLHVTGLSTGAAAALVGVSPESLTAAVKRGELEAGRTPAGHSRFDPAHVRQWADRRRRRSDAAR